jgi:hypothetical protein
MGLIASLWKQGIKKFDALFMLVMDQIFYQNIFMQFAFFIIFTHLSLFFINLMKLALIAMLL